MSTSYNSSDSSSSERNTNPSHEYYEELDNQTLNLHKRKLPKPIQSKAVVKEVSHPIDPIQQLNAKLNRQFRPDLIEEKTVCDVLIFVPPAPSPPSLSPKVVSKQDPALNPVIFDARAKPVRASNQTKEPSTSVKEKLFNRIHQLVEPTIKSNPYSNSDMSNLHASTNEFQVPPGMMLVPMPQQQSYPKVMEPSQIQPTVSQYKPPTVTQSNSFKHNRVAPPPALDQKTHNANQPVLTNSYITPSSILSTNQILQSSYPSQPHQQQNAFKHINVSKPDKKKSKKQVEDSSPETKNRNQAFALYNQGNGRIEGVVQNRLNIANGDIDESQVIDDENENKSKCMTWLAQPLCLGLTRLSGIVLFGSMGLLGCAAIGGLIASIVTYTDASTTDAQWKILGMVVSAIMLITIIITLLIFICCYKHGYMFDKDDDAELIDASATQDAAGNEKQKAFLRKIYKFNRPNETPMPSVVPRHVKSPPPQTTIFVSDKQTNTDTTISEVRPRDFDRGVWPSSNAYGGISYRPIIPPHVTSRFIQVFPHEIEEALRPAQIIYQVVAPAAAIPSPPIHTRTIQIPASQMPMLEVVETVPKGPRTIHVTGSQVPGVEIVETVQKPTRTIHVSDPEGPVVEYIDATPKQPRTTIIRQAQPQQIIVQPNTRIEYVDVDEPRGRRIVQKPQYEIVEEVVDRETTSPMEEVVEFVEMPRHGRHHGRKKDGKRSGYGKISVKHIKSSRE